MLTIRRKRERNIVSICERSRKFHVGDTFKKVVFVEDDDEVETGREKIVYCGLICKDEALFRTVDGRVYFSICDGWGEKNGVLYGLERELYFDFGHATTEETLLAECENARGSYHSWAGAMAYHARNEMLDSIIEVVKKGHKNLK